MKNVSSKNKWPLKKKSLEEIKDFWKVYVTLINCLGSWESDGADEITVEGNVLQRLLAMVMLRLYVFLGLVKPDEAKITDAEELFDYLTLVRKKVTGVEEDDDLSSFLYEERMLDSEYEIDCRFGDFTVCTLMDLEARECFENCDECEEDDCDMSERFPVLDEFIYASGMKCEEIPQSVIGALTVAQEYADMLEDASNSGIESVTVYRSEMVGKALTEGKTSPEYSLLSEMVSEGCLQNVIAFDGGIDNILDDGAYWNIDLSVWDYEMSSFTPSGWYMNYGFPLYTMILSELARRVLKN